MQEESALPSSFAKPFAQVIVAIWVLCGCRPAPSSSALDEGIRALQQGDRARALALLRKATQRPGDAASAHANIGLIHLRNGRLADAADAFQKAAAAIPSDPRPLEYLAHVEAIRGRWPEADRALQEARRRDPRSPRVLAALAVVRLYTGSPEEALSLCREALAIAPNYSVALYNMAIIQRDELKRPAEARQTFQRYLAVAGADPRAENVRLALRTTAENVSPPPRGPSATRGQPPPSETPSGSPPPPISAENVRRATDEYNRAVREQQAGRWAEAAAGYEKALALNPGLSSAFYNLGLTRRAMGEPVKARDALRKAVELEPGMVNARYMMGVLAYELNEPREAVQIFSHLLQEQPDHADAHLALGRVLASNPGQIAAARRHFERYLALAPRGAAANEVRRWLEQSREQHASSRP